MNKSKSVHKTPNKLISEKSPYLLQHAYNPVNWYPWCEEAFEKAKKENKPIFLSVGYSTCHWCHVMEKESFEDEEVTKLMNESFISIKVDREERPDIDNVYMTVCQMLTGSGGWPLTVIMTPEKKPFFAGTYFSKYSKYGRAGMMDLLPKIGELWKDKYNDVVQSSKNITIHLKQLSERAPAGSVSKEVLDKACEIFKRLFDDESGGFGNAPKFPTPHNLLFLLRYWKKTKDTKALYMVEKTLQKMREGGIFDQIGFGFHRYSTDSQWLVPHFEKMLYDQAMLAMVYVEAYQATKKEEYKRTAEEICTYVLRDLRDEKGGFYCGEDADSEGEEGKFYVWREEEIINILDEKESKLFLETFNLKKEGNYLEESVKEKNGTNILFLNREVEIESFENARRKLFIEREKRIHPHKDKKILTSWNGLMIAALSKLYQITQNEKYIDAAKNAFNFLSDNVFMKSDSSVSVLHSYCDGVVDVKGFIDDYAFLIWGLLELYESTFEKKYLENAVELNKYILNNMWDQGSGAFFYTSSRNSEKLILRQKEIYDGAIPSGNSVSMLNLLKLWKHTALEDFENYALKIAPVFADDINHSPVSFSFLLCALDYYFGPSCEIVVVGDKDSEDTKTMLSALRNEFIPNKVLILNPEGKTFSMVNDRATVYVCQNFTCKNPVTDVQDLITMLQN